MTLEGGRLWHHAHNGPLGARHDLIVHLDPHTQFENADTGHSDIQVDGLFCQEDVPRHHSGIAFIDRPVERTLAQHRVCFWIGNRDPQRHEPVFPACFLDKPQQLPLPSSAHRRAQGVC